MARGLTLAVFAFLAVMAAAGVVESTRPPRFGGKVLEGYMDYEREKERVRALRDHGVDVPIPDPLDHLR